MLVEISIQGEKQTLYNNGFPQGMDFEIRGAGSSSEYKRHEMSFPYPQKGLLSRLEAWARTEPPYVQVIEVDLNKGGPLEVVRWHTASDEFGHLALGKKGKGYWQSGIEPYPFSLEPSQNFIWEPLNSKGFHNIIREIRPGVILSILIPGQR